MPDIVMYASTCITSLNVFRLRVKMEAIGRLTRLKTTMAFFQTLELCKLTFCLGEEGSCSLWLECPPSALPACFSFFKSQSFSEYLFHTI